MSDSNPSEEANNLLPKGILDKISISLLFDDRLFFLTNFLIIEEDASLIAAEVDDDPEPLPLRNIFLLFNFLPCGHILNNNRLTNFDTYLFSISSYPTNNNIFDRFIKKKQTKNYADFLSRVKNTFFILISISSKEWIVDNSVHP